MAVVDKRAGGLSRLLPLRWRGLAVAGGAGAAIVAGWETLLLGRADAVTSPHVIALDLVAGWALVAGGLVALMTRRDVRFGWLLLLAGLAWFVSGWSTPSSGSALVFTAGLVFAQTFSVLVLQAAVVEDGGRVPRGIGLLVCGGYVIATVLGGLLPAMLFQPREANCFACPDNLVAVASSPTWVDRLGRWSLVAGVVWATAGAVVAVVRAVGKTAPRRLDAMTVAVPAAALLLAVAIDDLHSVGRGLGATDASDRSLHAAQAISAIVLALGSGWALVRRRQVRAAMARLSLEAARIGSGGLAQAFGAILHDPTLQLLYRVDPGRTVDASGTERVPAPGQEISYLVRSGATVALMAHRPGLLAAEWRADDISRPARLLLEQERLRAQTRMRLVDLQRSRLRIVDAGDRERRRLERDLHDGAQQRLVALALDLRVAALRGAADADTGLGEAEREVIESLESLRRTARGLYPRELADEGLRAALEVLADTGQASIVLADVPDTRCPQAVEATAYLAATHCAAVDSEAPLTVEVRNSEGRLALRVTADAPGSDLSPAGAAISDRVSALGGSLTVTGDSSRSQLALEIPCGS